MHASTRAAQRYSRALFSLACDREQIGPVHADMQAVAACLAASAELRSFLRDYLVPAAARRGILAEIFSGPTAPLTFQFVLMIETRRRCGILPEVCACFERQYEQKIGIVRGECSSSSPLAEGDMQLIESRLQPRTEGRLVLAFAADSSLLGGFRVRVGDIVYDLSIATQLRRLKQEMRGVPATASRRGPAYAS